MIQDIILSQKTKPPISISERIADSIPQSVRSYDLSGYSDLLCKFSIAVQEENPSNEDLLRAVTMACVNGAHNDYIRVMRSGYVDITEGMPREEFVLWGVYQGVFSNEQVDDLQRRAFRDRFPLDYRVERMPSDQVNLHAIISRDLRTFDLTKEKALRRERETRKNGLLTYRDYCDCGGSCMC